MYFEKKNDTPKSKTAAKHKLKKLTFDPNAMSLPAVTIPRNAQRMCCKIVWLQHPINERQLILCKLSFHLKRSLNLAYLKKGTDSQTVAHREREMELSRLEIDEEQSIPTMTEKPPNNNQRQTEQLKIQRQFGKKPGLVVRDCATKDEKGTGTKKRPFVPKAETYDW